MTRARHWFYLLLLTLAITTFTSASESQWLEVRSPHFSVVTDAGEKRGREVAVRFEQMRAVYGTLLVKANVNIPVPLQIVAFRNTKEMRQFAPLWKGKPTEVAGLFQGGADRSFIMLDMSVENPWQVVFHEYAHQLMNGNISERIDPWFEEGFAEYFSTIEVDNKQARVGKISDETYQIVRQSGLLRVADLFRVQQNSSVYNESGDRRTVFYAESAMVVHYLYDNKLIPKLADFFTLVITKRTPIDEALKQAFGMDAQQFDKALRNYISSGRFSYYAIPTPPGIANAEYTAAALPSADANAVLADIHLHSPDYLDKAIEQFQSILAANPNHAASLRGLGYAYLQKHDLGKAGDYFRRSADLDSKDPRVHYYSALLMQQEGSVDSAPEKLATMKKELQASIALDPNFADAYSLLAFALMFSGEHEQAVQSMQKAITINPRNEGYQMNLASMYLTARKTDAAISMLKNLVSSSNPVVSAQAQQLLREANDFKAALSHEPDLDSEMVHRVPAEHPSDTQLEGEEASKAEVHMIPASTPPMFLKGKLVKIDCSNPPVAFLTVVSGTKTWRMKIADTRHTLLIGADDFSCAWTNRKVALNYHETGDGEGTVMSLEIQ